MRRRELLTCEYTPCGRMFNSTNKKSKYCTRECCLKAKRERDNLISKEKREIAKEIGNCTGCFNHKEDPRYTQCLKCRTYAREWARKNWREKHDKH